MKQRGWKKGQVPDYVREKISKTLTGRKSIPCSEEKKRKIGLANSGKIFTLEHRRKLSLAHKGKKHPESWYRVMRGRTPWNKGKKGCFSPDGLRRLAEACSRNKKGIKFTEEHKRRISIANKGKKMPRWIALKGRLSQCRINKPTSIEVKLYNELKKRGLLFETQKLINGRFIVDAYIPSLNLVIEADGDYWHSLPKTVGKDKAENAYLTKCGYKLLRLPEHEINDGSFKEKLNFN